jgi:hypothetical protein
VLNKTFYRTWGEITHNSRESIAVDQIFHYLSVQLSDVAENSVIYVPNVDCGVSVPIRIIFGMTIDDIKSKAMNILYSKVAFKESTIQQLFSIIDVNLVEMNKVQNRDIKTILYVSTGTIPNDPVEILKCAVYDATKSLTLIKNKDLCDKIKCANGEEFIKWLKDVKKMAEIFNRFRIIFLSIKVHECMKKCINRISKLSKVHHKKFTPPPNNKPTTGFEIVKHLKYLMKHKKPEVYQIRNGKMWCTRDRAANIEMYKDQLKKRLPSAFVQSEGTRVALPTSEKNFVGPFPIGTQFTAKSLIIGINWFNQEGRVDLDLSSIDIQTKIGWNDAFYSQDRQIVYSGDITDATDGANEYLSFRQVNRPQVVMLNNFTSKTNIGDKKFTLIIANNKKPINYGEIIDPADVIASIDSICDNKQKTLGIVYPTVQGSKFILIDKYIGYDRVSKNSCDTQILIDAFVNDYLYMDEIMNFEPNAKLNMSNDVISKSEVIELFALRKNLVKDSLLR